MNALVELIELNFESSSRLMIPNWLQILRFSFDITLTKRTMRLNTWAWLWASQRALHYNEKVTIFAPKRGEPIKIVKLESCYAASSLVDKAPWLQKLSKLEDIVEI